MMEVFIISQNNTENFELTRQFINKTEKRHVKYDEEFIEIKEKLVETKVRLEKIEDM